MRSSLLGGLTVLFMACGTDVNGTLALKPDAFHVVVGASTFVTVYLNDGTGDASLHPVDAELSLDPAGVVMLTPTNGIQKVTGVAPGQVVLTAIAFDQTAKVGFTVTSP
ncbi:hypothetical protein BH11MYX1_BH11MYX1_41930 [soil metagenome]